MRLQPLPAFEDNYIWLLDAGDDAPLLVDPGQAAPVLDAIGDGPGPLAILLTHHHGDHIGGVSELLERWPGTPVHAPFDERIASASHRVGDGDAVAAGRWRFQVLAIPGHTRSHVAYHWRGDDGPGLLFSGDTLFSLGCGRMFEGTPAQMHASLQTLAALPGDTLVCCGHEYTVANAAFALAVDPDNAALRARAAGAQAQRDAGLPTLPATLAEERACNPFLRCHDSVMADAAARHAGQPLNGPVEVFAALRAWKDGFRG